MTHDHSSDLTLDRGAGLRDLGPAFKWAVGLNVGYVVLEAAAGLASGSLALLADAAHNLTDVGGLLIAWGAVVVSKRPPTDRFTYGLGRSTILAALANAIAILIGVGAVVWEAVRRFGAPVEVPALTVLLVASLGIAINAGTALLFRKNRVHDLNAEGAFLHMAADAAVSLGVVISAVVMLTTGWAWVDPVTAILVSIIIAWTAYGLLKSSLRLTLDGVPASVDREEVRRWLMVQPGVTDVHDLHVWALSTTMVALTAHLVVPGGHPDDAFLEHIADDLKGKFSIAHTTLQIEIGSATECRLAPADII